LGRSHNGMEPERVVTMIEFNNETTGEVRKSAAVGRRALPAFRYENGYTFSATDLGNNGVKIELYHENDVAAAIILPPRTVAKCGKWLLGTLGQDKHGLPDGFCDILKRLSKHEGIEKSLRRGDKKTIKEALKALRSS